MTLTHGFVVGRSVPGTRPLIIAQCPPTVTLHGFVMVHLLQRQASYILLQVKTRKNLTTSRIWHAKPCNPSTLTELALSFKLCLPSLSLHL